VYGTRNRAGIPGDVWKDPGFAAALPLQTDAPVLGSGLFRRFVLAEFQKFRRFAEAVFHTVS